MPGGVRAMQLSFEFFRAIASDAICTTSDVDSGRKRLERRSVADKKLVQLNVAEPGASATTGLTPRA